MVMTSAIQPLILCPGACRLRAALFLSGEGSNAARLLEQWSPDLAWEAVVVVTDRPETSRAAELAARYGVPLLGHDILRFYQEHGENRVTLATDHGRRLREDWTAELRIRLAPYRPDFGILAGFIPLCNITADFPCLNVHPGDLTYLRDGRRYLVGLHQIPIERAMLAGLASLRSSVILAQPYTGGGHEEMDSGPLLGISTPVNIDLEGHKPEELQRMYDRRPDKKPASGYGDELERLARRHQERLKQDGDWVVFPAAVRDFAAGKFGLDKQRQLYFQDESVWRSVTTVEYDRQGHARLVPTATL